MRQFIIRRLLMAIPILLGISIITFAMSRMAPGDPLSHYMNPDFTPQMRQELLEKMGLGAPLPVQYYNWLKEAVRGNLGYSLRYRTKTVNTLLKERMGPTLNLTLTSLLISFCIAVPIGVYSALRQYSKQDYALTILAFLGLSIPAFFLALSLIYIFSLRLGWLPAAGMMTAGRHGGGFADRVLHAVLPVAALSALRVASFMRYTRSAMLEVIRQDYIRTARSKGLSEKVVIYKHALRNALIPVITVLGISIATLFSGALLIETVFSWPGLGKLAYDAVFNRDYPILMGTTLLLATMVVFGNLVADVTYALVDPRIRYD